MGVVYKAEDTRLGRPVALKFVSDELSRDPEALSRFAREAQTASALNHPNICTIHDIGEQDGRSFIVMEYLEGTTLKDRLAAGSLSLTTVLDVGTQIADALDAAHTAGIIHRDIKPANIFIGSRDRVKVLDFGLAKMRATARHQADVTTIVGTRQGVVMGTAAYMAPEQASGETVDHRADIWSLGVVLCEMVTGTRPAPGVRLRVEGAPELERIISKCLETDRELRYQHAAELRTDLARLSSGTGAAMVQHPALARRRTLWLALGAAAVIAAVVAWCELWPPSRGADRQGHDRAGRLHQHDRRSGVRRHAATGARGTAPAIAIPQPGLGGAYRGRTLALMQQRPDARLTPELAQDVCVRTASAAVLDGSIASLGSQYVVALRARNCSTGDMLADEQAQAARKEDVLGALSQIAVRFRTRVGESLATIEKHSVPLEEATTPSLEAWKPTAPREGATGQRAAAVTAAVRACGRRSTRTLRSPHARLGINYSGLGEIEMARQSMLKAYQLRDRASDVERFYHRYGLRPSGDRQSGTGAADDGVVGADLSARSGSSRIAVRVGYREHWQIQLSIDAADRCIALDPDIAADLRQEGIGELHLNRLADAEATLRRATEERRIENDDFFLIRYFIAFLSGDAEAISRAATAARGQRSTEDMISHLEALALARSGRLQEARRTSAVAVDIAQQAGQRERAALFEVATAVWEAFYGNAAAARQKATQALALARGRYVDYAAAFSLALSGDVARARTLAGELERDFPEDTSVQYNYLPALRALFSLSARDPSAAIRSLQSASRFDLAPGSIGFYGHFGMLYPIYVRGEAYRAAQQPAEAVAEFQRILDHRSIVIVDPMDAMARLQLARTLAVSGDTVKAKSAYNDLLTLWKDADPKIPVVEEARAEYARLP